MKNPSTPTTNAHRTGRMLGRTLWVLPAVIAFLGIAQGVFFLNLLCGSSRIAPADAIVCFEGMEGRAGAAFRLADLALAPNLVISPASAQRLEHYDRVFRPVGRFDRIMETKARTTFENALFTRKIIREHGFDTLILVTSWYHMPRSYLLLKAMLMGDDVTIQTYRVPTGKLKPENWYRYGIGWKMVYNEMVETWGSLIELTRYRLTGKPYEVTPGKKGILSDLKKYLLFDIDKKALSAVSS